MSILSVILTVITSIFSVLAYARVVGLENSTHKVQYMPLEEYNAFSTNIEEAKDTESSELNIEEYEKKRKKQLVKQFQGAYEEDGE